MNQQGRDGFAGLDPSSMFLGEFDDGAVLVDLVSGAFYRLNSVACFLCTRALDGTSWADLPRELVRRFGVDEPRAAADVLAFRKQLGEPAPRPGEQERNPITFRRDQAGFTLCWHGEPVWLLNESADTLTYVASGRADLPERDVQLLWVVPHVLLLRGQLVLHASAVKHAGAVLAFCGPSGLGKTTLARTLARGPTELVSEDLVLLSQSGNRIEVVGDAEARLRGWVGEKAVGQEGRIDVRGLDEIGAGPRLPLGEILFPARSLECARLARRTLGPSDAMILLVENSFAELGQPELWRRLLQANRRLVEAIPHALLDVPEGLERLRAAARAQTWMVRS